MSRVIPAVIATLLGLIALASFKSSPGLPATSSARSALKSTVPAATAPPNPTTSTIAPNTPSTSSGSHATTPPTAAPTTIPPTTSAPTTRTIDGDPVDNQYGTVQVEVTLQGRQIVGVTALQLPSDRQHSAEISQQAGPILQQEVLQAQSAQIDIVSGATYTSASYAQSLQSALDRA